MNLDNLETVTLGPATYQSRLEDNLKAFRARGQGICILGGTKAEPKLAFIADQNVASNPELAEIYKNATDLGYPNVKTGDGGNTTENACVLVFMAEDLKPDWEIGIQTYDRNGKPKGVYKEVKPGDAGYLLYKNNAGWSWRALGNLKPGGSEQ